MLKDLRDKHAKGEVPLFREKLEAYKQEFTKQTLLLSEEQFIALKSSNQTSLKEFVQCKVYETLQVWKQDLAAGQGENTELFQKYSKMTCEKEKLSIELAQVR